MSSSTAAIHLSNSFLCELHQHHKVSHRFYKYSQLMNTGKMNGVFYINLSTQFFNHQGNSLYTEVIWKEMTVSFAETTSQAKWKSKKHSYKCGSSCFTQNTGQELRMCMSDLTGWVYLIHPMKLGMELAKMIHIRWTIRHKLSLTLRPSYK